jgi:hypothetical protein
MDQDVHLKIIRMARKESRSIANMIEYILKKHIESYEKKNGKIELTDEDYGLQ